MGGDLGGNSYYTFDNFHRVYSVMPHHLPQVQDWKTCHAQSNCHATGWTVSENYYERLDEMDTGFYPVSAYETKAKMLSRQMLQIHLAGDADASFKALDDNEHMCKMINQKALDKALSMASPHAVQRYNQFGKKLVMGDDMNEGAGPLWIWTYLKFTDNGSKTQTVV